MTPLQTLKALVELQKIDRKIFDLEKDREQVPKRLTEINELLAGKKAELSVDLNQLAEAEMGRRLAESDLKAEKEKIKKWESRLNDIRSNRDYQALSREVEGARKANLGIEDEILRKMQEIEELKASSGLKKEDYDQHEAELSSERNELEQKLATMNASIDAEGAGREQAMQKVDPRWYQQYQAVRERRMGIAVIPVLDEHCQGCHMGIPPQLYNIVLRGEGIETCPHCSRIVYFEQALADVSLESEDTAS